MLLSCYFRDFKSLAARLLYSLAKLRTTSKSVQSVNVFVEPPKMTKTLHGDCVAETGMVFCVFLTEVSCILNIVMHCIERQMMYVSMYTICKSMYIHS